MRELPKREFVIDQRYDCCFHFTCKMIENFPMALVFSSGQLMSKTYGVVLGVMGHRAFWDIQVIALVLGFAIVEGFRASVKLLKGVL